MTPLMERVILAMQSLGDREVSLKEIREAGKFDSGREVGVCLHYLVNREEMASVREVKGSRERPAVWKLTDLGRMYRPLLTVGTQPAPETPPPPASEPTPTKARRATPKSSEPAGTVADLVQEIKAEQDAEVARGLVVDPGHHPRLSPTPAWLQDACKRFEEDAAAESTQPLILTLRDDGTLAIVADGGRVHVALTPGQTSQLGRFLQGTAGVWECPF